MNKNSLDMDKCFQCGASKKEAKRPFWGFNHCTKACHRKWSDLGVALWTTDEAKKHEAVQKVTEQIKAGKFQVPERHEKEWIQARLSHGDEKSKLFWLEHRKKHEAALVNLALRTKTKTKSFDREMKKLVKELERATLNLNRLWA